MSFPNGSFPPNNNNNNHNKYDINESQNSKSNSKRYDEKNREIAEPVAIINTFAQVISHKFSSSPTSPTADSADDDYNDDDRYNQTSRNLSRLDELYKSPAYGAEKKILRDINNNGMANGVLAGLCTFAALRASPHLIRRFARRYHQQHQQYPQPGNSQMGSGGYKLDALSSTPGQPPKPRFILRAVKLAVDAFASVTVAMFASTQFADRTKLLRDMADIPLVEGRSLISDELCDDFVDVYRSIPKRTWDRYEGTVDTLDAIGKFVRNCMRRRIVEEELRRESGGGYNADGGVEIPSPGVPRDLEVNIVWGDRSRDVEVGREREDGGEEEFPFDYRHGSGGDGDFRYDLSEFENNFGDELEGIRDEKGWNLEPTMDTSGDDEKTFGDSRGNRRIGK